MTNTEKNNIVRYRKAGKGCTEIAGMLGLSVNTVKSFCRRHGISPETASPAAVPADAVCRQCGASVVRQPHRKHKHFCSDACRLAWWHAHRDQAQNAVERRCQQCGTIFRSVREQKYCSRACYFNARYGGQNNSREYGGRDNGRETNAGTVYP